MSTTETTEKQNWQVREFESRYGPAVRFTSPSGFHFELVGTSNVLRLLTKLALTSANEIQTPDGTRFYKYVATNKLVVVDTEPWLNGDFAPGSDIGDIDGLVTAIGHFLLEKAWTK